MPQKFPEVLSANPLIDIHCHQYSHTDSAQLLSWDVHELTCNDAGIVEECSSQESIHQGLLVGARYFSLGIHPWFIERQNIDTAFQILASFTNHPKLLAIGECGLDKCIALPLPLQIDVFTRQIELAERIGKPLIIHCVRAYSELLQLKKQFRPKQAWIFHGFNGKPALATQLIKQDCYLSFGAALLDSVNHADQALRSTPADRLFLETDTAKLSIGTIYAAAAKIRGTEVASLRQQINNNFLNVFLND